MATPSTLRDSTQIVLPSRAIAGLESTLHDAFTITIVEERDGYCRIIGSPVEIKATSEFLVRNGVKLP